MEIARYLYKYGHDCVITFEDIVHLHNISEKDSELLSMNEGGAMCPSYQGVPVYNMDKNLPLKGMVYSKNLIKVLKDKITDTLSNDAPYFIYTGSKKIIDGVCSILEIQNPEKNAFFSYNTLGNYGNLSAASVAFMVHGFKRTLRKGDRS